MAVVYVLLVLPAYARHKSASWAAAQFSAAQRMQQTLEARPVEQRTRLEYQRAINAYHHIYLASPNSSKAASSVMASAQLTEEMGRRFEDDAILRSAVREYEFLRHEYPTSRQRFDALFRIGEIYRDDLHDKAKADEAFQEFVSRYPRNPLAAEARKQLEEPVQQAVLRPSDASAPTMASRRKSSTPSRGGPRSASAVPSQVASGRDDSKENERSKPLESADAHAETHAGKLVRVTGIRHWSTPDYTRVAIDLDGAVKYQAQRIEDPDRVFFDLYDTRLDRTLLGKKLDVDDGFLKQIRISQFDAGCTRVVLDLDELTDYGASFQKDPPRLIIEVRNRDLERHFASSRSPNDTTDDPDPMAETPTLKFDVDASQADEEHEQSADPSATAPDQDGNGDMSAKDASAVKAAAVSKACTTASGNSDVPSPCTSTKVSAHKDHVPKPGRRTYITRDGVRKTVVDGDDDEDETVAELRPAVKTADTPTVAPATRHNNTKRQRSSVSEALDIHEAQPTAAGDRSLIRALGLKIGKIVIDPGHGGHDTGTIGPNGLEEKDLVLDVSRRLGKLLVSRLGAQVVYTRKDDTFIPLEDRTAIANREGADLFVSVHANSSPDADARGVETYYLNFTSSPDALEVAARENAVSEKSIHELQDLVKKIALKEKIEESREFATDVETSLHSGLAVRNPGVRDRGVKKAPFIVLIGANMPSILAEISFVSNPGDERRLETAEYRQRIAESLYRGIANYVNGLSGVKVASKIDKSR